MAPDPRIHVSLEHLRGLEGAAAGLSFLPRQPSGSVLSGRHASRLRGRGLNFEEMRDYLPAQPCWSWTSACPCTSGRSTT